MLTISNRKKPLVYSYTPPANTPSASVNLTIYNEAKRREARIQQLVKDCPYQEGDVVLSTKPEEGDIRVLKICKAYHHMGKDEVWPKSDNPMLVTAQSVKTNTVFYCTINYLKKKM